MKVSEIKNSIVNIPGIGPSIAKQLAKLNIFTVGDLLQYYPRDWEDRTKKYSLAQFNFVSKVNTIAKVIGHEWFGYGRMKTLKIIINDGTLSAELIAFNRPFLEKSLPIDSIISVTGKFDVKFNKLQSTLFEANLISPTGNLEDFDFTAISNNKVYPIYKLSENLTQKIFRKAISNAITQYSYGIENEVPDWIIKHRKLLSKSEAIKSIHNPENMEQVLKAKKTLIYEEFYKFQTNIIKMAINHRGTIPTLEYKNYDNSVITEQDFTQSLSPLQKEYLNRLPYKLTEDQKKVIFQANTDIDKSYNTIGQQKKTSMRALLQGDVGSGKTLVSFFICLRIKDYGSQCAFMAPTEILAKQHAENAALQLENLGVRVAFLTGNINAQGRTNLLQALKEGKIDLLIGTHALFSKNVQYCDLAFVIIDEQHRFGVMQRSAIIDKGRNSLNPKISEPNLLMMSATPIPQSLALTLFGDLDIYTIKSKPLNRKEIITYLTKSGNENNAYEAVRKELQKGHQAYFVYPAIEENLEYSDKSLKSAEEMYNYFKDVIYKEYRIGLIHSKISEEIQNQILTDFKNGTIHILVATTVVEVGVDVPNATCMVIEQADRFGLAALHQLRGRVGRSNLQSFCFLIYRSTLTEKGKERMLTLRETSDGFKIAEKDLKLRGPGEISGTIQSGIMSFPIGNPIDDNQLMQQARADVIKELSNIGL